MEGPCGVLVSCTSIVLYSGLFGSGTSEMDGYLCPSSRRECMFCPDDLLTKSLFLVVSVFSVPFLNLCILSQENKLWYTAYEQTKQTQGSGQPSVWDSFIRQVEERKRV